MRDQIQGVHSAYFARYIDRETREQTGILLTPHLGKWAIRLCARNEPLVLIDLRAELAEAMMEGIRRAAAAPRGPRVSRSQIWCQLRLLEIPGAQSIWTEVTLPPSVEQYLRRFSD
jgi:hypothetical protein